MKAILRAAVVIGLVLAVPAALEAARGGRGGGHGGGNRGGGNRGGGHNWQNWRDWAQRRFQGNNNNGPASRPWIDPQKLEEMRQGRLKKLLAEGWEALRAGDAAEAVDSFSDALALRPYCSEAHMGMGLARALNRDWVRCQSSLETAQKYTLQPPNLAYDLMCALLRTNQKGRGMVVLNGYLAQAPKPDEIAANAQIALLATLTDAEKKTIDLWPTFQKTLEMKSAAYAALHQGQERFGMAWVPADAARKLRDAKKQPPYPVEFPFLLPDRSVLGLKGQKVATNELLPEAAQASVLKLLDDGVAVAARPDPDPGVKPEPVVKPDPVVNTPPVAGVRNPPRGIDPIKPAEPVARTVRGAAFAVADNLMITCLRLVEGARKIEVQACDGKVSSATVIESDGASGLALLKVSGDTFAPMALAETFSGPNVGVAAFMRPTVFQPELDVAAGELRGLGNNPFLKMASHPRSAGSPIVDNEGRVVGVVSATRDELPDKLSIIPLAAVRQFANGKFKAAPQTKGDPDECVAEIQVSK
jgi:hypothetical protein